MFKTTYRPAESLADAVPGNPSRASPLARRGARRPWGRSNPHDTELGRWEPPGARLGIGAAAIPLFYVPAI